MAAGRKECGRRHDRDPLERSEREQVVVSGDDVVGAAVERCLEDTVVAVVVDDLEPSRRNDLNASPLNEIGIAFGSANTLASFG